MEFELFSSLGRNHINNSKGAYGGYGGEACIGESVCSRRA